MVGGEVGNSKSKRWREEGAPYIPLPLYLKTRDTEKITPLRAYTHVCVCMRVSKRDS